MAFGGQFVTSNVQATPIRPFNGALTQSRRQPPQRSNTWPAPPSVSAQPQPPAYAASLNVQGPNPGTHQNVGVVAGYPSPPTNNSNSGFQASTQYHFNTTPTLPSNQSQAYTSPPASFTNYALGQNSAGQGQVSPGQASFLHGNQLTLGAPANAAPTFAHGLPPTLNFAPSPSFLSPYMGPGYGPRTQTPSLGVWMHLNGTQTALPGQGAPTDAREMPNSLRRAFRLQGAQEGAPDIVAVPPGTKAPQAGRSLEDLWKLVDQMDRSRSEPLKAHRQSKEGIVYTIRPPANIAVCPLQRVFIGTGAIPNELADRSCTSMTPAELLDNLNQVLGTKHTLQTANLAPVLDWYINTARADFGRAYGEVRRGWFCDLGRLASRLQAREKQDSQLRQSAIEGDRVVNPRIPPRRVWDLYSNRVLPFWVLHSKDIPRNVWAVSHSWIHEDAQTVWTVINGSQWPVILPHVVDLNQVRIELLNLGAEYVWLDVLCLRQISFETLERTRLEEWRLDVPIIGHIYRHKPGQVVIVYFNGLGRPFNITREILERQSHWLNRVWTLQEATPNWMLGGLTIHPFNHLDPDLFTAIDSFRMYMYQLFVILSQDPPDLFALVKLLRTRFATNPVDSIGALGYLLRCSSIPMYVQELPPEYAWCRLLQELNPKHLTDLAFHWPAAGQANGRRWRPTWAQLYQSGPPYTPSVEYSPRELLCLTPPQHPPTAADCWHYAYVIETAT